MNQTRIVYKDRWAIVGGSFLLGYFFVNLGQTESLFTLWKEAFYFRDIGVTSVIVAIVWLAVRTATIYLDRRYDWFAQPVQRIVSQVFVGFLLPVLLSLSLVLLFFEAIIHQDIARTTFPVYEFPVSLLVIAGLNLFYTGYYLYLKARAVASPPAVAPAPPVAAPAPTEKILIMNSGSRNIPLPATAIAYFHIEDNTVYATAFSGERYMMNASLDDLTQELPDRFFFRANRQYLLQRNACKSFANETYGKLKVEVTPTPARAIIISQQKAPDFKKWLEKMR